MKIRATGVAVIMAVVLAACASASGGPSGTGGSHTTTVAHSSSSGHMGGGTTTSADPCTAPAGIADCGSCSNQSDCVSCASMADQDGVMAYNDLVDCVFCTGCYTTCDGAGSGCKAAPTTTDPCDTGTPGMTSCNTCQGCVLPKTGTGTCTNQLNACKAINACVDLVQNLASTCGSLPM